MSPPLSAGQFYGGKGYLHTNAANLLPAGALDLSFYARGYVTTVDVSKDWNTVSNGTSAFAASFGFTRRVELGFTQILYQDLNATFRDDAETTTLIPGDTYIRFKIGGWAIGSNMFASVMPALRYRVGKYHNIQFEPYESEAVEAELGTMLSYYWRPLYPDEDKSIHLNLSYLNHNDGGSPMESAQGVHYLMGFLYPLRMMDIGLEFFGNQFIKQPDINVLGRENWAYVTPFARYKPFKGLQFTMGIDVLVSGDENTTEPDWNFRDVNEYPNYAKWRITGRINFAPSTAFYISPTFVSSEEPVTGQSRITGKRPETAGTGAFDFFNRQDLFKWAIEEQVGGVDAVNLDLNKLRQERMKAEEELKKLKKKLEQEK
jgi:hypothetical protein